MRVGTLAGHRSTHCRCTSTSHYQADQYHAERNLLAIQMTVTISAGTGPNNENSTIFPTVFPDSVAKLSGSEAAAEETEGNYDFDYVASSARKKIAVK